MAKIPQFRSSILNKKKLIKQKKGELEKVQWLESSLVTEQQRLNI